MFKYFTVLSVSFVVALTVQSRSQEELHQLFRGWCLLISAFFPLFQMTRHYRLERHLVKTLKSLKEVTRNEGKQRKWMQSLYMWPVLLLISINKALHEILISLKSRAIKDMLTHQGLEFVVRLLFSKAIKKGSLNLLPWQSIDKTSFGPLGCCELHSWIILPIFTDESTLRENLGKALETLGENTSEGEQKKPTS